MTEPDEGQGQRIGAPPAQLPAKRNRKARGGAPRCAFDVRLRVITPILGGAATTRTIDSVDVIRVPTLRGHLRFWWRALYGGPLSSKQLYEREQALWGGAADGDGGRSPVEIRRTLHKSGEVDGSDVRAYGAQTTAGAYALWPARATSRGEDPAPRRFAGTSVTLHIDCPEHDRLEIQNALRALILFGGYGSRTRRGTGAFTVESGESVASWLPSDGTREDFSALFERNIFEPLPGRGANDTPLLAGASLRLGSKTKDPEKAWTTALNWLQDFRQGQPSSGALGQHDPMFARDRGDMQRPGRSNFPEADKVRRLSGSGPWAHDPLHNGRPAYPRAGFGLPIVAQFQGQARDRQRYRDREPDGYELRWKDKLGNEHDRLASPLCLGAMPILGGQFVPYALWLFRSFPEGGMVGLKKDDPRHRGSQAPFDLLVADGDTARFAPLAKAAGEEAGTRLRAAFLDWLSSKSTKVVAP